MYRISSALRGSLTSAMFREQELRLVVLLRTSYVSLSVEMSEILATVLSSLDIKLRAKF